MKRKPKAAVCSDCGRDWNERPSAMFHDHIWKAMGMKEDQLLCLYCANVRLLRDCEFNHGIAPSTFLSRFQPTKG
jgi:hypothetical protein